MQSLEVNKGDHVWLTHVPNVGFHCQLVGKNQLLECMQSLEVNKGDHVWLTHVPNVGFHCQLGVEA